MGGFPSFDAQVTYQTPEPSTYSGRHMFWIFSATGLLVTRINANVSTCSWSSVKCASRITTPRTFRPAGQHTPIAMLQRSSFQCQCFKVRRGWCLPVKYSCASSVPPQVANSRSSTPSSMRITLWWHRCRRLSPHPSRGRQPSFLRKTPTRVAAPAQPTWTVG